MNKMKNLTITKSVVQSLNEKYKMLPKNSLEFGGMLCGHKDHNIIVRSVDIPSQMGKRDSYAFDTNIIKSDICAPLEVVGMWHTHSEHSPMPSRTDRETTNKLDTIGCVVTNKLNCFKGKKDLSFNIV